MVVKKMVEMEMVWTCDSDQCALGHCNGSGGGYDAVVVAACVYKKTCVFIAFSRLSCNPTVQSVQLFNSTCFFIAFSRLSCNPTVSSVVQFHVCFHCVFTSKL